MEKVDMLIMNETGPGTYESIFQTEEPMAVPRVGDQLKFHVAISPRTLEVTAVEHHFNINPRTQRITVFTKVVR